MDLGLGKGHQQQPGRTVQVTIGHQHLAVRALNHPGGLALGVDAGHQGREAIGLFQGGHRLAVQGLGLGEAREGHQLAGVRGDQAGGAGRGVAQHLGQPGPGHHRGAPGAHIAAVDIDRADAAADQGPPGLVLQQGRQGRAAHAPGRVVGGEGIGALVGMIEARRGRRGLAEELQPLRPVGREDDQPILGGQEEEVLELGQVGLAHPVHHQGGGGQQALVLVGQLVGMAQEGADPIDRVAIGGLLTVIEAVLAAAGAVAMVREPVVELGVDLRAGAHHGQPASQGVGGRRLLGPQGVEQVFLGAGARLHIERQVGDPVLLHLLAIVGIGDHRVGEQQRRHADHEACEQAGADRPEAHDEDRKPRAFGIFSIPTKSYRTTHA